MRLINAELLKKDIAENSLTLEGTWAIEVECAKALIDSAPTVKIPENAVNCVLTMFGNCSYNETGCSDCEIKDKIRKALNSDRPKGKWIFHKDWYYTEECPWECSKCGTCSGNNTNFCSECGAEMEANDEQS